MVGVVVVRGRSMLPTLRDGDRLLVRYGAYARTGDVVVARLRDGTVVVKRAPSGDDARANRLVAAQRQRGGGRRDSRALGVVPTTTCWRSSPLAVVAAAPAPVTRCDPHLPETTRTGQVPCGSIADRG